MTGGDGESDGGLGDGSEPAAPETGASLDSSLGAPDFPCSPTGGRPDQSCDSMQPSDGPGGAESDGRASDSSSKSGPSFEASEKVDESNATACQSSCDPSPAALPPAAHSPLLNALNSNDREGKSRLPVILGAVFGALAAVALLGLLVFFIARRKVERSQEDGSAEQPSQTASVTGNEERKVSSSPKYYDTSDEDIDFWL